MQWGFDLWMPSRLEGGAAVRPKAVISFTEKTKFVYAINKGISKTQLRKRPPSVNDLRMCSVQPNHAFPGGPRRGRSPARPPELRPPPRARHRGCGRIHPSRGRVGPGHARSRPLRVRAPRGGARGGPGGARGRGAPRGSPAALRRGHGWGPRLRRAPGGGPAGRSRGDRRGGPSGGPRGPMRRRGARCPDPGTALAAPGQPRTQVRQRRLGRPGYRTCPSGTVLSRSSDDSWVDPVADQVQAPLRKHGFEMEVCVWYDPIGEHLHALGYDGSAQRYFHALESSPGAFSWTGSSASEATTAPVPGLSTS